MAQIVLFENVHPSARAVFEAAGYSDIATYSSALPAAELRTALAGAEVVGIRSRTQPVCRLLLVKKNTDALIINLSIHFTHLFIHPLTLPVMTTCLTIV